MICFVLMGDEKFSHTISVSVEQIRTIYPSSRILFYNWGVGSHLERELKNKDVEIVDWTQNIAQLRNRHATLNSKELTQMKMAQFAQRSVRNKILFTLLKFSLWTFVWKRIWKKKYAKWALIELLLLEKTACMNHATKLVGDEHMVFLDADAILTANIDELFSSNRDLTITIRRNREIQTNIYKYQVVNTGVIVFSKNSAKREIILRKWKELADSIIFEIYLAEQTAMGLMIERNSEKELEWKYGLHSINLEGVSMSIEVKPCEVYNFNWIEELIENGGKVGEQKILHFKGSRHSHATFKNLFTNLKIE